MGACLRSSSARSASTPVYVAILSDMYKLVPFEEQQLVFTKKIDVMKYYEDYNQTQWQITNTHFKQHVKTLIDHIEDCKIRLIDSSLYVENKIVYHDPQQKKYTSNPIIIKMSVYILVELVQNLNKFVLHKEIMMTNNNRDDDSKILDRVEGDRMMNVAQGPLQVTYISDNFLRFELIFSAIMSLLINSKQIFNMIWIDSMMQALQSFSSQANHQYQSEKVYKIVEFLDYIIGYFLARENQNNFDLELLFDQPEDQKALIEMIQSFSDQQFLSFFQIYLNTLSMVEYEKFFLGKNQSLLFNQNCITLMFEIQSLDNELTQLCQKFIVIVSKRAFLLKTYDELFLAIFRNYDQEFWRSSVTIQKLTDILLQVAKREGFLQNLEIFFLSRFLEFIQNSITESQQVNKKPSDLVQLQLTNKQKSFTQMYSQVGIKDLQQSAASPRQVLSDSTQHINTSIKRTVIKQIGYMLSKFESSQFLLFSQENIIKTVINNFKLHPEDDSLYQESKKTLLILLQAIAPDLSAFTAFMNLIVSQCYNQYLQIKLGKILNEIYFEQLLTILKSCVQMAVLFKSAIFIKDDQVFPIIQFADHNPKYGLPILQELIQLQIAEQDIGETQAFTLNTNVFQFPITTSHLMSYKLIQHALANPLENLSYGIEALQYIKDAGFLISLCLKIVYGERYTAPLIDRNQERLFDRMEVSALFIRGLVAIKLKRLTNQLTSWTNNILISLNPQITQAKTTENYLTILEDQHQKLDLKAINLSVLMNYLDQDQWTDFDNLEYTQSVFIENLHNQNEEVVNMDEIQIYDDERGSAMYQSMNALNSLQDFQPDNSFEKVLHSIRKTKQKQGKFDQITAQDQIQQI